MKPNLVDVLCGKLRLSDISREIAFYMQLYSPKELVVQIKRQEGGYHTTLWIDKESFEKKGGGV